MFGRSISILLILLGLFACANASVERDGATMGDNSLASRTKRMTNGERLARGFKPKAPKRLYDASRVHPAPARRSADPTVFVHVAAFDINDNLVGYMVYPPGTGQAGLTQTLSLGDTFSPQGEGLGQYVQLYAQTYNPHLYWLWMYGQTGTIGNPNYVAVYSGQLSQNIDGTSYWDTPTGYPGPLIPDTSGAGTGVLNTYYQMPNNGLLAGKLYIAASAEAVNNYAGQGTVTEDSKVTLSFLGY